MKAPDYRDESPLISITPAKVPTRITLDGDRVDIVPLDPDRHGNSLFQASGGPEHEALWKYLSHGPFSDRESFYAYLRDKAASPDPLFYAIVDKRSRKAVGHAAYMRTEPRHRVIEVGHVLFTGGLQKTAAATEAMYLMAKHAFEDLGYRRYEWKCNSLNEASRRAALRFGFQFEGVFRQHMIVKSRNRDTAWFALLDGDWPHCKTAFENWLNPANFDASGRQKVSLETLRSQGIASKLTNKAG